MTGFAYGEAADSIVDIFNSGNSNNGSNATTGIGSASVTHQVIIRPATASTFAATASTWKGLTMTRKSETTTPESNETSFSFGFENVDKRPGFFSRYRFRQCCQYFANTNRQWTTLNSHIISVSRLHKDCPLYKNGKVIKRHRPRNPHQCGVM